MSGLIDAVLGFFGDILAFLHDLVASVPFLADAAWGWAIVLLTLVVRIALLPLAIKQTRSMRAIRRTGTYPLKRHQLSIRARSRSMSKE